jgi:hypothetical protein
MSHDYYQEPRSQRPYGQAPGYAAPPRQRDFDDQRLKHSGLGIASFIIAILSGIFDFVFFVIVGLIGANDPSIDETSPVAMVVGLILFAAVGFTFIGLGLGIVGVVLPNRNKLFPWLGLVFNALVLLGVVGLVCLCLLLPDA